MADTLPEKIWVTYLELREPPSLVRPGRPAERIGRETPSLAAYLELYRRVGGPLRWDQRLLMPEAQLEALLGGGSLHIYVARNMTGGALGFCEFDRGAFPQIELMHFGLVPEAQGHGIGPWLLSVTLQQEWNCGAQRIWLHSDTWDHPAAMTVYLRAGFKVYEVRYEPAAPL